MQDYTSPWKLEWNKLVRYPGGREIDRFRGIDPPKDDGRPEAWIASDTRVVNATPENPNEGCASVLLPSGKKRYLFEIIKEAPEQVLGRAHMDISRERMGLLVKLLDAERQLGLQCHPTRENAKRYYNSDFGKAESWYIIGLREDCAEPPYVLMGFKEGITRQKFGEAFDISAATGEVGPMEACCHKIEVKVGDVFNIAPGLPHAVGAGCFLVEVQEPSDITIGWKQLLRSYPDQVRALHRDILLDCYEYDGGSVGYILDKYRIRPEVLREGAEGRELLLLGKRQTPYFSFSQLEIVTTMAAADTGYPRVMLVLEGSGSMEWDGGEVWVNKADEFFIPYGVKNLRFTSDSGGLNVVICNPPTE